MSEEEPIPEPEMDGGDALERELRREPVEERKLTPEERERLRRATARIQNLLSPKILSVLADQRRSNQFRFPDSFIKEVLGKGAVHTNMLAKFIPAMDPSWMQQLEIINSDVYKQISGLGQSSLTVLNSVLAKNADFGLNDTATKVAAQFATEQNSWLKTITPLLERLKTGFYPANLQAIKGLEFENVEEVVMLDGIALYGVPRTEISEKLINAESTRARRDILGRRGQAISTDCRAALEACTSASVAESVSFAVLALDVLDKGIPEAAQALAAAVLDTIVNDYFGKQRYKLTPNRDTTTTTNYDKFTVREFIAFAPLWQAYQTYYPANGDPIPHTFSRHASVHGVGRRQFSRRNTVQALLFVTGLLVFLDEEAETTPA